MPFVNPDEERRASRKMSRLGSFLMGAGAMVGGIALLRNPELMMHGLTALPGGIGNSAGIIGEAMSSWLGSGLRFAVELGPQLEKHQVLKSIMQGASLDTVIGRADNAWVESVQLMKRLRPRTWGSPIGRGTQFFKDVENIDRLLDDMVSADKIDDINTKKLTEHVSKLYFDYRKSGTEATIANKLNSVFKQRVVNNDAFTIEDVLSYALNQETPDLKFMGIQNNAQIEKFKRFINPSTMSRMQRELESPTSKSSIDRVFKEFREDWLYHRGSHASSKSRVIGTIEGLINEAVTIDVGNVDVNVVETFRTRFNQLLDVVVDPDVIVRRNFRGEATNIIDAREGANIGRHFVEFTRRHFQIPFIGINPLDPLISPQVGNRGINAVFMGKGDRIDSNITNVIGRSDKNLALLGNTLYTVEPDFGLRKVPGVGSGNFWDIASRSNIINDMNGVVYEREQRLIGGLVNKTLRGTKGGGFIDWISDRLDIWNQIGRNTGEVTGSMAVRNIPWLNRTIGPALNQKNNNPLYVFNRILGALSRGGEGAAVGEARAVNQRHILNLASRRIEESLNKPIGSRLTQQIAQTVIQPLINTINGELGKPTLTGTDEVFLTNALERLTGVKDRILKNTIGAIRHDDIREFLDVVGTRWGTELLSTTIKNTQAIDKQAYSELRRVSNIWAESGSNAEVANTMLQKSSSLPLLRLGAGDKVRTFFDRATYALERTALALPYSEESFTANELKTLDKYRALNIISAYSGQSAIASSGAGPIEAMLLTKDKKYISDLPRIYQAIKNAYDEGIVRGIDLNYVASTQPTPEDIARFSSGTFVVRKTQWNPEELSKSLYGEINLRERTPGQRLDIGLNILGAYAKQFFPTKPEDVTGAAIMPYRVVSGIAHMLDPIGLGFSERAFRGGVPGIISSMFFNRVIPVAGVAAIYNWLDRELDATPIGGLDDWVSAQTAGHRLAMSYARDVTGMTAVSKYVAKQFPGSEFISKDLLGPIPGIGDVGLNVGTTESYQEMQDYYNEGYAPVRSGRWWFFSKTPWGGGRISGFEPNWYLNENKDIGRDPELQEQERLHSWIPSVGPGPGFNPLSPAFALLDPYWKERYFYDERPYPITGPMFNETSPWAGLNATVGQVLKPRLRMHVDEVNQAIGLVGDFPEGTRSMPVPYADRMSGMLNGAVVQSMANSSRGGQGASFGNIGVGGGYGGTGRDLVPDADIQSEYEMSLGNAPVVSYTEGISSPLNPFYQAGMSVYHTTEMTGLRGYMFQSIFGDWGTDRPVMESFDVGSLEQSWWKANLGGGPLPFESMQETTEIMRRFWPHERYSNLQFNPIRNNQPDWMPSGSTYFEDFTHGDPYGRAKVSREGVLAGPGFERMWGNILGDDMYRKPRASMIGYDYESQVRYFAGLNLFATPVGANEDATVLGDAIHKKIQDNLERAGYLVEAERSVRDPVTGITGHLDVVMDTGEGETVVELKSVSPGRMQNLPAEGYAEHRSQLNFYLGVEGQQAGFLFYINQQNLNDVRLIPVEFSREQMKEDIDRMQNARSRAASLIDQGIVSPYQPYSDTARAMTLALSAPWSDEYEQTYQSALDESGDDPAMLARLKRFNAMANQMKERKRFTPYRYKGVQDPEDADLFSRIAGPVWETFSHLDTPIGTKFLPARSALEDYERSEIYGENFGSWDRPVQSWIIPTARSVASKPVAYATGFGAVMGMLYGRDVKGRAIGAAAGAGLSFMLSSGRSIYENTTGKQWIPKETRRNRAIEEYFSMLEYVKWMGIYNKTKDYDAKVRAMRTAYGMDPDNWQSIYAVPAAERVYIRGMQKETNPTNREHILQMVSTPARRILQSKWGMHPEGPGEGPAGYFRRHYLPPANWAGWRPDMDIEDYKVSYIDNEGLDMHDFSQWDDDVRRTRARGIEFTNSINSPRYGWDRNARYVKKVLRSIGLESAQIEGQSTGTNSNTLTLNSTRDVTKQVAQNVINGAYA